MLTDTVSEAVAMETNYTYHVICFYKLQLHYKVNLFPL